MTDSTYVVDAGGKTITILSNEGYLYKYNISSNEHIHEMAVFFKKACEDIVNIIREEKQQNDEVRIFFGLTGKVRDKCINEKEEIKDSYNYILRQLLKDVCPKIRIHFEYLPQEVESSLEAYDLATHEDLTYELPTFVKMFVTNITMILGGNPYV